ncbi:hypothetical protein SODG_000363 [Sodalis praecaptivus]|nr:hypothetical protein NVIRENTERO_03529 [Sodalis praecaptivus]
MARPVKHVADCGGFHVIALMHHQHPIRHFRHHAHIVGNKHHPHAHLLLQQPNQLQDLRLNGDIQRGRGLIGNKQRRPARQRHGNHHPLAHPARKLMRVAIENIARFGDPHQIPHMQGFLSGAAMIFALVQTQGFRYLFPDREYRIQRGHRLLKNHRHIRAAQRAQRRRRGAAQIHHLPRAPAEQQRTALDAPATELHQTHHRQRRDGFPRPRLADDSQRLTAVDVEREVTHRFDTPSFSLELDAEIAHR